MQDEYVICTCSSFTAKTWHVLSICKTKCKLHHFTRLKIRQEFVNFSHTIKIKSLFWKSNNTYYTDHCINQTRNCQGMTSLYADFVIWIRPMALLFGHCCSYIRHCSRQKQQQSKSALDCKETLVFAYRKGCYLASGSHSFLGRAALKFLL